jgi:hypothetical protein
VSDCDKRSSLLNNRFAERGFEAHATDLLMARKKRKVLDGHESLELRSKAEGQTDGDMG